MNGMKYPITISLQVEGIAISERYEFELEYRKHPWRNDGKIIPIAIAKNIGKEKRTLEQPGENEKMAILNLIQMIEFRRHIER